MQLVFVVSIIIFSLEANFTQAYEIQCPLSITETPMVSADTTKWSAVTTAGERQLQNVSVYNGTLSDYSSQVPDDTQEFKTHDLVTWNLVRGQKVTFWVGCSYLDTSAILFQKIKRSATSCTASFAPLPNGKKRLLSSLLCK
jgi:hypothetical protein